jgi:hypothetical protein
VNSSDEIQIQIRITPGVIMAHFILSNQEHGEVRIACRNSHECSVTPQNEFFAIKITNFIPKCHQKPGPSYSEKRALRHQH